MDSRNGAGPRPRPGSGPGGGRRGRPWAVLLWGALGLLPAAAADAPLDLAAAPVAAPPLAGPTLDGGRLALKDLRGQPVVLHFWASFCRPCLRELPSLQALARRCRAAGLEVVTVNVDRGDPRIPARLARRLAPELPVVLDPGGGLRRTYEIRALPTTYVLDATHRLRARAVGARHWDGPEMMTALRPITGACGPDAPD